MNELINPDKQTIAAYRIILIILFAELVLYFFCDIHTATFVGNTFIGFEQDPLLWLVYFTGLPQFITSNILIAYTIDFLILVFILLLIKYPFKSWIATLLFILLFLFSCIFTAHLNHRNYQSGYLLVLLPLLFYKTTNKQIVFEFTRYFLLFFYVSAAVFKLKSGSIFNGEHFSYAVVNQFTPYFLEHNFSIRTTFNTYIITHNTAATVLYILATVFEFIVVIGFFTKRFDSYLALFILLFHLGNWFIMDIAPIGQIAFICTLFFSEKLCWKTT